MGSSCVDAHARSGAVKSMSEMSSFANVVNLGGSKGDGKASLKLPSPPFPHDLPEIPLPFLDPKEGASKR